MIDDGDFEMSTSLRKRTRTQARELFTGLWHNQHNSELVLQVDEDGLVSGTFIPGIGAERRLCEQYRVTGFACNDVIAFSVAFEEYGSVTSWSGQLSAITENNNAPTIQSLWHMSVDVGDQAETALWKSMISGADNFVRGPRQSETNNLKTASSHPLWLYPEKFEIDDSYCCE